VITVTACQLVPGLVVADRLTAQPADQVA